MAFDLVLEIFAVSEWRDSNRELYTVSSHKEKTWTTACGCPIGMISQFSETRRFSGLHVFPFQENIGNPSWMPVYSGIPHYSALSDRAIFLSRNSSKRMLCEGLNQRREVGVECFPRTYVSWIRESGRKIVEKVCEKLDGWITQVAIIEGCQRIWHKSFLKIEVEIK